MKTSCLLTVLVIMLWGPGGGPGQVWAGLDRLRVTGSRADLEELPVVAEIDSKLPVGAYVLRPPAGDASVAAQVFEDRGRRYLAVVLSRVGKGGECVYSLNAAAPSDLAPQAGVYFHGVGRNLQVLVGGRLLTEYRVDFGRKPFFFPLNGPTGESFTRAYPLASSSAEDHDHPHQTSFWLTHGNVSGIDFWSDTKTAGTIKETERVLTVEGPVLARLSTKNDWIAPDGKKICADLRSVTFYRTAQIRMIDFDITIRANSGPVTFGDTKEGMFGIRVASSMDVARKTGGRITNAEGLCDESAWGQASPWVDYVGPVGGKPVGIAILNHPDSFRYPTTWHVRPYGLFAANPFGWHDFHKPARGDYTIAPDESIHFAYRVILHEGATKAAGLPAHFLGYATPPKLELLTDQGAGRE